MLRRAPPAQSTPFAPANSTRTMARGDAIRYDRTICPSGFRVPQ